jgi:hypothetical protein
MRPLVLRLSVSLLSVTALLLLVCSLLFSTTPARSSAPGRSDPAIDARWIELIRSSAPGPQPNRSAAALPTLNLHLMDNVIAGRASSPALISLVVWRNNSAIVRTAATPYPDGVGYLYVAAFGSQVVALGGGPGGGVTFTLQPGDVISLTQSGASVTLTVPALKALVDAGNDQVYGAAPANRSVTAYLYATTTDSGPYTQTANVDAHGVYTAAYTGAFDVRPRDSGYVAYSEAPGRATYVRCVAPFLRAQINGSEISGLAAPLSWVNLTVADATGQPYAYRDGYSTADGSFGDTYSSYWGIKLRPGDRITATSAGQTFTMRVLTLNVQADLGAQTVMGDAPANQAVEVQRFSGPLCCAGNSFWYESPAEKTTVTATAEGRFTAALALARPNYGAALVVDPDGYQTYARFAVPYLAVRMGGYAYWRPELLTGQIADVATPMTVALQGPSGYFKDVRSVMAASDGYFSDYGNSSLALDSGDVITVSTAQSLQVTLQLPPLTGQIDPVTDIVSGTAPPGARLALTLYSYALTTYPTPYPTATPYIPGGGGGGSIAYTVSVTASARGDYLVNLHGVVDLYNYSSGEISLITPDGHAVTRILSLGRREDCDYRPRMIYVGGNLADFGPTSIGCDRAAHGIVRLRDAAGRLKAEQILPVWNYYSLEVYFYTGAEPVAIAPGDSVEVEWSTPPMPPLEPTVTPRPTSTPYAFQAAGDHFFTVVVPTLTVQLNPAANALSGKAPAGATVALDLYREYGYVLNYTATVDAQGHYTVDLPAEVTLAAGDSAQVTYTPIEPPGFAANSTLPVIHAELYQPVVYGTLPPLAAYTITLQTSLATTLSYRGFASNNGNFWLGAMPPIKPGDVISVATAQHALRLDVPALTAHIERASATVFGQAPPFAQLRVGAYYYDSLAQNVTATASGAYSVTFPSLAPLNTTYGRLIYFDAAGNQVGLSFATVHWEVIVNNRCLYGIVDMAGAPLTLVLHSGSGAVKSTAVFTPTYTSYTACFTAIVQSGDRIALHSAAATEVFTVPLLTARHDYGLKIVEGIAAPNQELFTQFQHTWNASRRTFSDNSGRYGVDTSDLHPPLLSRGRVYLLDTAGNSTSIYFTVLGYPIFLPVVSR